MLRASLIAFLMLLTAVGLTAEDKKASEKSAPPKGLIRHDNGHWSPYDQPQVPEGATVHVVAPGDTLWSIAAKYLDNPYLWTQIWELNSHVKDPHWIYPGDRLIIKRPEILAREKKEEPAEQPPKAAQALPPLKPKAVEQPPAPAPPQPVPQVVEERRPARELPAIPESDLYCAGFIADGKIAFDLLIVGADQERYRTRFGEGDIVYLNKGANAGIAPGSEFLIVRPLGKVKSIVTGESLGTFVSELGKLKVVASHPESATAQIQLACDTVMIGDMLAPFTPRTSPPAEAVRGFDPYSQVVVRRSGHIVLARNDLRYLSAGNIVYLDVGRAAGVKPGDRLAIFRPLLDFGPGGLRSDVFSNTLYDPRGAKGFHKRGEREIKRRALPMKMLGELLVISAQERTSTALITYNREEILIGDEVAIR